MQPKDEAAPYSNDPLARPAVTGTRGDQMIMTSKSQRSQDTGLKNGRVAIVVPRFLGIFDFTSNFHIKSFHETNFVDLSF